MTYKLQILMFIFVFNFSLNMEMKVDNLGTMYFQRSGQDNDALPVVIGSHLDTQPTGGKYDGILGVLAGVEIVKTLNDLDLKTKRPIMIVNWTNEEGCRFAPALMASSGYAGLNDVNKILQTKDAEGNIFENELKKIGWQGKEEVGLTVDAAAKFAFNTRSSSAVLLSQRMIGAKQFKNG